MSRNHRIVIKATVVQCELNTRGQRQYLKKYCLVKDLMKGINVTVYQVQEILQDKLSQSVDIQTVGNQKLLICPCKNEVIRCDQYLASETFEAIRQ